ncbi:hypothetical protein PybrP1_002771 [[Pythium] brassicae (nom. inval.)]|nr:hypothetical protein PybrP1_002771 [[Pythium] brassicae (nom. inval.)]
MLLQPNAADSSYGSIAAPQPANTASSLDPTSTRSLLDWLLFTRAARVNAELQHRNLELETLLPPEAANATAACAARLSFQLDARNRPLWMALLLSYANSLALCGVGQLVMAAYAVFAPVVLHQVVLGFSVESAEQLDRAALGGWCLAFFGFRTLNVFVTTQVSFATNQIWLRLTAAIRSVVFSKAMRKCAHLQRSEGAEDAAAHKAVDINNLVNSDATDVVMATLKVHSLWLLPLQIAVVTFLLYSVLDVAAFAGVAVIAVSLFGNYLLSKKMATSDNGAASTPAVCVVDGTFSWSDPSASALSQFLLRNIDLVRDAKHSRGTDGHEVVEL